MPNKSQITLIIIISFVLVWGGWRLVSSYWSWQEFHNTAIAAGGFAVQDAGRISKIMEPCILDTPANAPATCAASCPLVTAAFGSGCTGYIELDATSQYGTTFLAVPVGFVYSGGGSHPSVGMSYIAGGNMKATGNGMVPQVMGIPLSAERDRLWDMFDYVVAMVKK